MGGRTATGERVVSSLPCGQLLLDGLGRTVQARARGPRLANHVVALKEGWPLVLGFRETPYSLVHVENMRRLILAGATLLPPVPAFYIGGEDLGRFLDHSTLRLLDRLGIPSPGGPEEAGLRWCGAH